MSLYALSDLHLSFASDKSMEVFRGWENYTDRIKANWKRIIKEDDVIVLAGDTSWSVGLEAAEADFRFLEDLPGKKLLLKGNHDYWWSTANKMKNFFIDKKLNSINIIHNNCYEYNGYGICGTRGWVYDGTTALDHKVIARECGRLEASIAAAEQKGLIPIVFLHYPPVYTEYVCEDIVRVLKEHSIKQIYYGHIHGSGRNQAPTGFEDIKMRLISCDCVDFTPIFIM